ncbi:MAG: SDR family oxidoreductase [Hyphomicrobiaceae bacterium]
MDLGISGRNAIVCAASKGLGRACAMQLAKEGVNVVISARTKADLERTADEIRKAANVKVEAVACDVTTEEGRAQILKACPNPDILINNAGGPPPGDFKDFSLDDWRKAVEWNMITPLALIKSTVYGMMDRKWGRILNITSQSVKAPIASLELSNGARAGLTGAVAVMARRAVKHNVTINNILPGPFETDRLMGSTRKAAEQQGIAFEQAIANRMARVPAGRFGQPEEFGAAAAFLCSSHAGFITGQNMLLDGGIFPGAL